VTSLCYVWNSWRMSCSVESIEKKYMIKSAYRWFFLFYKKRMKIIFVRHSHTVIEPQKPNRLRKLSEKWIQKAIEISADKQTFPLLQKYYTSPQLKAIHTTALIASAFAAPISVHDWLDEITSITNKRIEDFDWTVKSFFERKIKRINGWETIEEAMSRFHIALEEIVKEAKEEGYDIIAVVTHWTMLALFCECYSSCDVSIWHKRIQMPDFALFDRSKKTFISSFWEWKK